MITSNDNEKLKLIRKLRERKHREREGLFVAEGEDLVEAAGAAGCEPVFLLRAGADVEPDLLDRVSSLGSGTACPGRLPPDAGPRRRATLAVYLHGVGDPGNVGTIIRSAHALADGPVVLGPGCADPYSPKAVRASMGSIFARPPARGEFAALSGNTLALDVGAEMPVAEGPCGPAAGDLRGRGARGPPHRDPRRGRRTGAGAGPARRPGFAERRDGRDRGPLRARK